MDQVASPPPAAAEREALDARANAVAPNGNRLADEAITAWRVVSMEEAVRVLGGQIRLIDGLTPNRIEVGPGTAVAGADPGLQVVRVVYADGAVTLDEQRPAPGDQRPEGSCGVRGGWPSAPRPAGSSAATSASSSPAASRWIRCGRSAPGCARAAGVPPR